MTEQLVLTEIHGPVGLLRLNRPEKLNALSAAVLAALAEGMEALESDEDVCCMVLTGSEKVFAAGADIEAMAELDSEGMRERNTRQYWQRMRAVEKPVVAAVSGWALGGGCELALSCDLVVASETAKFGQPEIKIGIIPGAGGTQYWLKAAGPYRAMEAALTGEPVGAREAFELGLVNRVVPVERYLEVAIELAEVIAARPPLAVKAAKQAVRKGIEITQDAGLETEREKFLELFDTEDQKEGMRAFLEKREAEWKGK
ncbi:MAG: enoyl-CoA hydratase-related protein [Anaerolineae bacterium]|nr:enoyl-CoA hydratase-related protein [Anaerolineae bacterium]